MKPFYFLTLITFLSLSLNKLSAQTIWTGEMTTFTKANNADWTQEANQDRITSNVWITRKSEKSIFNIFSESSNPSSCSGPEPSGTEWAKGTTSNISLQYETLSDLYCNNFNNIEGQNLVLHLISEDIYIDIKFISWTSGNNGGGFSYRRSTDQALSVNDFELNTKIKLSPNPVTNFITVSGLTKAKNYTIHNILGAKILNGTLSNNQKIKVENLTKGLYFLKFKNGYTIKFLKE